VGEIKNALIEQGAMGAVMSGSGPTVYGYSRSRIRLGGRGPVPEKFLYLLCKKCVRSNKTKIPVDNPFYKKGLFFYPKKESANEKDISDIPFGAAAAAVILCRKHR
jgi:hypothetical protein